MIFVPYTQIQPATTACLEGYAYIPVEMVDEFAYGRYFQQRWSVGKPFINCEHDTVFWDGALEQLWDCHEPLCIFGHRPDEDLNVVGAILGLVKFSENLIRQIPTMWEKDLTWLRCDANVSWHIKQAGIKIHQHYPHVTNANPNRKYYTT